MASTVVAVAQMQSTPDVEHNLVQAEGLVRHAAGRGAKLVVLPECFAYLGPDTGQYEVSEALPDGGPIFARMSSLAREHGIEVLCGGFWERRAEDTRVYNSSVLLDAHGALRAVYRKIHLFDVDLSDGTRLMESDKVAPGTEMVVTDSPCGPLGLSICYDLRFPELYRGLVDRGARVLSVPAAFTLHTGKDHWHVLLAARAIESQCHLLAAAQTGHHFGKRVSYGHAQILDPWGTVLAQCGEGPGVAVAEVDDSVTDRVRAQLPSLANRRL